MARPPRSRATTTMPAAPGTAASRSPSRAARRSIERGGLAAKDQHRLVRAPEIGGLEDRDAFGVDPVFVLGRVAIVLDHRRPGGFDPVVRIRFHEADPALVPIVIGHKAFLDEPELPALASIEPD